MLWIRHHKENGQHTLETTQTQTGEKDEKGRNKNNDKFNDMWGTTSWIEVVYPNFNWSPERRERVRGKGGYI